MKGRKSMSRYVEQYESEIKTLQLQIAELKEVIKQMKEEKNNTELLDFPWIGNLGQWYWMVPSNKVIFNKRKVTTLGYKMEDLPKDIGFEFFTEKLHPDDYQPVMDNMREHLMGLRDSYETEYRIRSTDGTYVWYYDRGKVTKRDKDGNALIVSGIVFDISKTKLIQKRLKEANEKLNQIAITDALTGCYTRRYILASLEQEMKRTQEYPLSLIMLDIDHFKEVNDQYGHDMGDLVLKNMVNIILDLIGKKASLCRWGGEEFVILLPETKREQAVQCAKKIRLQLCSTVLPQVGIVTASFGVSSYRDGDTMNALIKKADDLMYQSKKNGRNLVSFS